MADECTTCYGTGEVVSEAGARVCPDCFGEGRGVQLEWRLRELARRYEGAGETDADVQWLVHEVRRGRDALVRVLTLCQDADEGDELARQIKYQVNEALRMYEPSI
jgi:hypothetical protein